MHNTYTMYDRITWDFCMAWTINDACNGVDYRSHDLSSSWSLPTDRDDSIMNFYTHPAVSLSLSLSLTSWLTLEFVVPQRRLKRRVKPSQRREEPRLKVWRNWCRWASYIKSCTGICIKYTFSQSLYYTIIIMYTYVSGLPHTAVTIMLPVCQWTLYMHT